ncbi:MAG: pyridoxamine kinase [Oscillospiraceae bacterium]
MERIKRIAAIHDISGLGKCSLTVALPIISASGVECACLPTALLSTHTGEFVGYTFKDLSDEMLPIARHWKSVGAEFDGIYSGYLASAAQEKTVEEIIKLLAGKTTKIIVDPVMADNGEYYSNHGKEMCDAFRRLCTGADIITPNITEAALLTALPYKQEPHTEEYIDALLSGLSKLCRGIIAITGVRPTENTVGVVTLDTQTGKKCFASRPAKAGVFYGTGDIFASAFAALLLRGAKLHDATESALTLVSRSIEYTAARGTPRRFGVDFESALPSYIAEIARLFPTQGV